MTKLNNQLIVNQTDDLLEKDIWKVEDIGLKPDSVHSKYYFNFTKLTPIWLKQTVKRYIRFQASRNSVASCHSYLAKLMYLSKFLHLHCEGITPDKIDRQIIVRYLEYLACTHLSIGSRILALIHLRTFHQIVVQEKWLSWPNTPLIYSSDFPKRVESIPRFIPETVLTQLQQNLHHLPEYMQRLINLLLETGRRISELCTLPFDCLEEDGEGDTFLKVNDRKLKKFYLIPISDSCVKLIKIQQKFVANHANGLLTSYLFPARRAAKTPHITARYIHMVLNELAKKYLIKDDNGQLWHFYPHQFRHTVGTRMINAGVPQVIVQRYLGHETPEMTARYAHIHNDTLKTAFHSYQSRLIDIYGKNHRTNHHKDDAKWLQHNIMTQALPNGVCALPVPQQRCPHANACLSCTHFRTHKQFLPQHKAQLETTNKIIETAKNNGWQRHLEMNVTVKENLENIISSLEEESHGS